MAFGPIQLVVIGFDSLDRFNGDIINELDNVRGRGVIRLIDALAVARTADGDVVAMEESDFAAEDVADIGTAIRGLLGMSESTGAGTGTVDDESTAGIGLTIDDVRRAADNLAPGTGALYLLFEHTWATDLKEAVREAGGFPVMQGFLTPEVVLMVGAELEAILEAEEVIELAEAVKGAALLDALITVEIADEVMDEAVLDAELTVAVADEIMDEAVQDAEDTVAVSNAIRSAAAAEAVRALIVAGLIEEAAAEEAAEALVAAGLIEEAAYTEAAEAAAAAQAEVAATSESVAS